MSDNMQQMDNKRYANALYALNECIKAGLSDKALQTIRFEMGIDHRDYSILVEQNLLYNRLSSDKKATYYEALRPVGSY